MGFYVTFKDKADKYRFNLKAGNGEVILSSEAYENSSGRNNGIESVQKNCTDDNRYENRTSSNGQPYFVLKAGNGQVIGVSEMYSSDSARDSGKSSVKKNGDSEDIRER